jgi:hypothetical protein
MWALNVKAGGPCLTPIRPAPATRARTPLAAVGNGKTVPLSAWRRRGPAARPLVAVRASGRRGDVGAGASDDEEAKSKASSSGEALSVEYLMFWCS